MGMGPVGDFRKGDKQHSRIGRVFSGEYSIILREMRWGKRMAYYYNIGAVT